MIAKLFNLVFLVTLHGNQLSIHDIAKVFSYEKVTS